jgi:hypothetical protein
MMLVEKLMHWEQLHCSHAQLVEIVQEGRVSEPGVGAPPLRGELGMAGRQPFHMDLIDKRVVPRGPGRAIALPGKGGVDHDTLGEVRRAVASVPTEVRVRVASHRIAKEDLVSPHPPRNRFGVGIEEQFGWIEAMAFLRSIRSVDAIAIALPWPELGHIPVPHLISAGREWQAETLMGTLRRVKEAEVHACGMSREQGKIHPSAIPGSAQGVRISRSNVHQSILLTAGQHAQDVGTS